MAKQTGLSKLQQFSEQLDDLFMAVPEADLKAKLTKEDRNALAKGQVSRSTATKLIWAYIKANDLQDVKNRKKIKPDALLGKVIGNSTIDMMQLAKFLGPHLQ